ncbi:MULTISPECIES: hypothetical protein [unclassified Paenibacillus]|uniref:hypothetical protein n=1 Tax=unclassified Paenibacillus TaxID=185978 RepID=UPI00020D7893|nr:MULTISPECIES: hypothetical protein [unclassified Paenibacillus]EGL18636.1 hypothetical protein HMPREF9413_3342 [Paenibacillus sp. HGF7]EPD80505.1 hypothetical protein HMPREF1207_05611 [Paenibacillus sp. HGH0039]
MEQNGNQFEIDRLMLENQKKLLNKRRFLEENEEPSFPFVVEFRDGRRGEAINPLYLMDLIIEEHFSDCEDVHTLYLLGTNVLRDLAASEFSMDRVRATVYSSSVIYDNLIANYEDAVGEELDFVNRDSPVILDSWDAWTVVASLIKAGYLKIYEKLPVWSDKHKVQGCDHCIFRKADDQGQEYCALWETNYFREWDKLCPFPTNGSGYTDYHEVRPEEITDPSYKTAFIPIEQRKNEYMGYKVNDKPPVEED